MSLDELLDDPCDDVPSYLQILLILKQKPKAQTSKNTVNHRDVTEIIGICMNEEMNAYLTSELNRFLHLTVSLVHFYFIACKIIEAQYELKMRSAKITFISDRTKFYESANKDLMVWNWTKDDPSPVLVQLRRKYNNCFKLGFLMALKPNEKKRTSSYQLGSMSSQKSPVMHSGYTMSNANAYVDHRMTQMGHTGPSLISSHLEDLSTECRREYGKCIAMSNALFDQSPSCFKAKAPSPMRMNMLQKYQESLGLDAGDSNDARYCNHLRNLGTSGFFKSHVRKHRDKLNDPSFEQSGVISVNITIDADANYPMLPGTKEWLRSMGYSNRFPFCNVNYSRRACANASERECRQLKYLDDKQDRLYNLRQAIFDAISECDSVTNYSKTFDALNGLEYSSLMSAIRDFNNEQRKLHCLATNGQIKGVYQQFLDTMGNSVRENVSWVVSRIKARKSLTDYTWISDCNGERSIPCHPLLPTPKSTYQGPIVRLTAAYDPMRYLSLFLDAYCDIRANIVGGEMMNRKNKLGYCAFVAIQCNGSLAIAEIVRKLSMDKWIPARRHFKNTSPKQCLWSMLVEIGKEISFSSLGSCTRPRFQISIGKNEFQFESVHQLILREFEKLDPSDPKDLLYRKFTELFTFLKKKVKHIGHVTGLKFLQMSALLGLLPLQVACFATVDSGGPGKIMKIFDPIEHPNIIFRRMHSEFSEIWGPRFTMAYFENLLCELSRELNATIPKDKKKQITTDDFTLLHRVGGHFTKEPSMQEDHLVMFAHRGLKNCVSNLFRLNVDSSGNVLIEMKSLSIDVEERTVSPSRTLKFDSIDRMCVESYYHHYKM